MGWHWGHQRGQEGAAGTWALLAAVGGAGSHRVGAGEAGALHLLAVHFARGALRGACGAHGGTGTRCCPALSPPPAAHSTHGWLCRVGARAHLAGANGTLDEAEGGHDGVPAGARASPRLVPVEVAACGRWARRLWDGRGGPGRPGLPLTRCPWDSPSLLSRARSSFSSSCSVFFSARTREGMRGH